MHHHDLREFPPVDEKILAVFGGSHGVLVAGRGLGQLIDMLRPTVRGK